MKIINLLLCLLPFVSLCFIPGVVIRGDYLYMKQTEVSNKEYQQFLSSRSKEDSLKYLPKSELWSKLFNENTAMEKYYFLHPAYKNYPVVNITYEQANAYCNWVTDALNSFYKNQKVIARLPTEKEWEEAARAGNHNAIYPWGTQSMRIEKGKFQGQFQANFFKKAASMLDGATITAPVTAYWENDFGLYNMSGNVSEMVSEKGLVKGGSWRNRADWLRIEKKQYVYSASPEVGFRYVIEVIKLPQPKKKSKPIRLNKRYFKNYFSQINDTLSIGKFEVTNELFQKFITRQCGDSSNHHRVMDSNWDNLFPYSQVWAQNYSTHPKFRNHPVVNVDYKSALWFCSLLEWEYERLTGDKVEIRLPTHEEWELAAKGGLPSSPYPWGGPFIRNVKGCFLANHNPKMSESENVHGYDTLSLSTFFQHHFTDLEDFDGEAVLAPVDSYYPNGFGLYNIAGNAAEMVLDSNYTKGGSWKSSSYYMQIDSQEEWDKQANPFTGFRVVMVKR